MDFVAWREGKATNLGGMYYYQISNDNGKATRRKGVGN